MVDTTPPTKKSSRKQDKSSTAIKQFEEEIQNLKNQLARALADYQNLEKRIATDKDSWIKYAGATTITELLPVLDTLKAAHKANPNDSALALTIKQFEDVLNQLGVTEVQAAGQPFDPNTMECLEVVDGQPENLVAEEASKGYYYHDRLLRPAKVRVYKKQEIEDQAESGQPEVQTDNQIPG